MQMFVIQSKTISINLLLILRASLQQFVKKDCNGSVSSLHLIPYTLKNRTALTHDLSGTGLCGGISMETDQNRKQNNGYP